MSNSKFIHVGCGLCAPKSWQNYDASPTLRLQNIPIAGLVFKKVGKVVFPDNVQYGDIVKGIKGIPGDSCKAAYCSHMLEHLSLNDLRKALSNVYNMLEKDGHFRMVLPDLEYSARLYIKQLDEGNSEASITFLNETLLGVKSRKKGFMSMVKNAYGNSEHLWMWDAASLSLELKKAGFRDIRKCKYGDSQIQEFSEVEEEGRFRNSFALEAIK